MGKCREWAAASVLLLGGIGTALAADLPVKALPAPVQAFTWSGCYVGANGGWIGSNGRQVTAPAGAYLNPVGAAAPPNLAGTGDFPADIAALTDTSRPRDSGGLVGGQLGCNVQTGGFVFGVEGDLDWTSLNSRTNATFAAFQDVGNVLFTVPARTEQVSSRLAALATFRGRAGFAWNQFFLYGTAGLAAGDVRSDTTVSFATITGASVFNGAVHTGSASAWRVGWTAGVGGEYAFNPHWSLKAEYLYVDLGTFSYQSPLVAAAAPFAPGYAWNTSVTEREHIVRVGLNYRWGGAPF